MMTRRHTLTTVALMAILFGLSAASCEKKLTYDKPGPFTFVVEITDGDVGSEEDPVPFSHDPVEYTLRATAMDKDGNVDTSFNGTVHLRIQPRGEFPPTQEDEFQAVDGIAEGMVVGIRDLHSTATIWVEDLGTDEAPGSYATGLSPVLTARNPTLRNIQEVDENAYATSALRGEFVEVDLEGRVGVVTGVQNDGFYMTDVSEDGFMYSSMYVYSHNHPDVLPGDQIVQLNGTVDEFYGFTELSYPSWRVSGTTDVPEPVQITSALVDDNDAMERYESGFVEVTGVTVCPAGDDFNTYGQWAVVIDPSASCSGDTGKINVVSTYTIPDFYPPDHAGEVLPSVKGNLRYHAGADPSWIIYTRFDGDITESGS